MLDKVREARDLASDNYAVWHTWALYNYIQLQQADVIPINYSDDSSELRPPPLPPSESNRERRSLRKSNSFVGASLANLASNASDLSGSYVIEAIKGFTRSLSLSHDEPIVNVLQDTLRLLTLWFSYGSKSTVFEVLSTEMEKISADNWVAVLPQLIARMHVENAEIAGPLERVLVKVALSHPQAIVCPILVAHNTSDLHQRDVALRVIKELRRKHNQLVNEATMVSRELLRVAITPHELWNDGLEKAAKHYVTDRSIESMVSILFELHESLDFSDADLEQQQGSIDQMSKIGYTTLRDISFRHSYQRDLAGVLFY